MEDKLAAMTVYEKQAATGEFPGIERLTGKLTTNYGCCFSLEGTGE
jgi:hypothetical protein